MTLVVPGTPRIGLMVMLAGGKKVAVADLSEAMVTMQLPVPEQLPLQPAKEDPEAAVAVKVTVVFSL